MAVGKKPQSLHTRASPWGCLSILARWRLASHIVPDPRERARRKPQGLVCLNIRCPTLKERRISMPTPPSLKRGVSKKIVGIFLKPRQEFFPLPFTASSLGHGKILSNPTTKNPNTFHKQLDCFYLLCTVN